MTLMIESFKMSSEPSTASSRSEKPAAGVENITDKAAEEETISEQEELQDDDARLNELVALTPSGTLTALNTISPPPILDMSDPPDNGQSVHKVLNYQDDTDHQATNFLKDSTFESSAETSNDDLPLVKTDPTSTRSVFPQENSTASIVKSESQDDSSTSTAHEDETRTDITPEALPKPSSKLGKRAEHDPTTQATLDASSPSRIRPEEFLKSSSIPFPSSSQSRLEGGSYDLPNTESATSQLLYFNDDLTQYDGDQLWLCMIRRCCTLFHDDVSALGAAHMALQKLRYGKCDALTTFAKLCDLAKHNQQFCPEVQNFLGILQYYPGGSLLEEPFNIFPRSSRVYLTKSRESCLACKKKGRACRGTKMTGSRCEACHHDKLNEHSGFEVDECYWGDVRYGIITWADAEDLYGVSNGSSTNLKRKAPDQLTSSRSKKRGTEVDENSTTSTSSNPKPTGLFVLLPGLGYQPRCIQQPSVEGDGCLPFFRFKLDTVVRSPTSRPGLREEIVFTNEWKSVKAAFVWKTWQLIRLLKYTRQFTDRQKYSFGVKRQFNDKEIPLSEEDLLRLDREIRAGKLEFFKYLAAGIFVCTATPGIKTS